MSRLFRKIEYVDSALKKYLSLINIKMLEIEELPLEDAVGRVLAEDLYSNIDVPPFNRAAMDGYAVYAEDTYGASENNPIRLNVVGESAIGNPYRNAIKRGEAVKIHTGAVVPEGANAVIPIEYVEEYDDYIEVFRSVSPFDNVGKKGEDVKKGELVLLKGTILRPYDLALVKSLGYTTVKVFRKLKVAIFSCGDELVDYAPNIEELHGKIIDTNRLMIKGYLREMNCEVVDLGIIKDDIEEIKSAIIKARKIADLLITVGGTSVGEKDLVPPAINSVGEPGVIIRGISASPGRPLVLSLIGDFPIISLPGYPVAAFIDFIVFGIPIIEKIMGIRGLRIPNTIKAKLRRRVPSKPGVRHYVRVKIFRENGDIVAEPIRITGSGVLSSIVRADGILVIPEDVEGYEAGEVVDIVLLRGRIGVWNEENI